MEIPDFKPEALGQKKYWHDVIAVEDLKDIAVTYIQSEDRNLYVYKENNITYIGSFLNNDFEKEMPNFFKNKEVIYFTDNNTGIDSMKLQQLY